MIYYLRNIKQGIGNLFLWLSVIWNDRWWDHYYLFKILRFKLGLMEKLFRKHGHHVNAEEDARDMKVCCDILDRLIADKYAEVAHKELIKKWGEIDMKVESNGKVDITRPNVKTDEDKELERKEFMECCKVEDQLEVDDINELFEIITKNVRKWWD